MEKTDCHENDRTQSNCILLVLDRRRRCPGFNGGETPPALRRPTGLVVVEVDFGAIEISTHASGEVVVDVWRKIGLGKQADEEAFLRDNPVEFV